MLPVSQAEDEESGEAIFLAAQLTEGRGVPLLGAELGPVAERVVFGTSVFGAG